MKCTTRPKHLGGLWQEKNRIDLNPPYQREGGVWSDEKKQLFIDSIVNKYDVPKLYFHDLRAKAAPNQWAVIDGKQRLEAIWGFFADGYSLAHDFAFLGDPLDVADGSTPQASQKYSQFSEALKEYFKSQTVDVVEVEAGDDDEIEDLFSRLNNGEPLNAAEKRNAMPGQMVKMIREVATHSFFKKKLGFANRRGAFLEVAAKFIKLEQTYQDTKNIYTDLKKKPLDAMAKVHKDMTPVEYQGLISRVHGHLNRLEKIFADNDILLGKQSYPQLYYAWVRDFDSTYAVDDTNKTLATFLEKFTADRVVNNNKPEDTRDSRLVDFGRLSMQGTNDMNSMAQRGGTLTRYFLASYPATLIKDAKRLFTDDERYLIWTLHGKKCTSCDKELSTVADMEADHVKAWAKGGPTSLENAQSLCGVCNATKGAK